MGTRTDRMARLDMILDVAMSRPNTAWYKNCKSVRKRKGKICQSCPFRFLIEQKEINRTPLVSGKIEEE